MAVNARLASLRVVRERLAGRRPPALQSPMLISRRRRFIFIHVDKAAGTSIQDALRPFCEPVSGVRLRRKIPLLGPLARLPLLRDWVEFGEHITAEDLRRCLPGPVWAGAFKFAFVRNPWARLVSRHQYLIAHPENRHHRRAVRLGFPAFVRDEIRRNRRHSHQVGYLCDRSGSPLLDFVGRFEELGRDFGEVCRRIGVEAALPHLNASVRGDYRSFYDAALREEVGRHFARDCELFGYDFDGLRSPVAA